MPITVRAVTTETGTYGHPFVGPVDHTDVVKVDISALTTDEVDEDGYLKPGVPFLQTGLLVTAGAVYGVTMEPIKIATGNTSTILNAATDCFVAVGTHGVVNRDIIEDNLGRALVSAELTGFTTAPCTIKLTRT